MLPLLPESKLIERPLTSPATAARMLKLGFSGRTTRASPPTFMRVRVPAGAAGRSSPTPPQAPPPPLPRPASHPPTQPPLPPCPGPPPPAYVHSRPHPP